MARIEIVKGRTYIADHDVDRPEQMKLLSDVVAEITPYMGKGSLQILEVDLKVALLEIERRRGLID